MAVDRITSRDACGVTAPQLGPVSLVQRCFGEGVRVRVVVRHCAGVRGECVGTVLAFDKHLNLVSHFRYLLV